MTVNLVEKFLRNAINPNELDAIAPQVAKAHQSLEAKSGRGSEFLGWLDLPKNYDKAEFERIKIAAEKIQKNSQILIVIGIGGSYLGGRAAIDFIKSPYYNSLPKSTPEIYFVGNSISPNHLNDIITLTKDKDFSINVISKSGTTTEPALAFRVFRQLLEEKYGKRAAVGRIFCTTDQSRGTLKTLADKEGYETFVIPDDIGGRFSVLTPVGLLPMAVAGCDISLVMEGALQAALDTTSQDLALNCCYRYAALRNILHRNGKNIEVLVSYEPSLATFCEWFKQLFGESEGKDKKGLFPASMIFSTDLHSLGQFLQDGSPIIFETVLQIKSVKNDFFIKKLEDDFDGLNFLSDQNMSLINQKAFVGTALAHLQGSTPSIVLEIPDVSEHSFGYLVYFFEKACAISGYILGVNPFDQPGVEDYKKNMFALLGKPGYEKQRELLEEKLKQD